MNQTRRWRRSALALCVATLISPSTLAVEYGNITALDGSYSIPVGQNTPNFTLGTGSSAGNYFVQIGPDASDDYAGGILISSVAENLRDGLPLTTSVLSNTGGQYAIQVNSTTPLGTMSGDSNVAAAYFAFADGWLSGYTYSSTGATTGAMDSYTTTNGISVYDTGRGMTQVWLPGVDMTDGVLIATSLAGSEYLAMVDANLDGSFSIFNHSNKADGGTIAAGAVGFAFVPYTTPNVAAGVIGGNGGVISGTENFSIRSTADGVFELTIDGYSASQGTLLVTPNGASRGTGVDNMITYQVVGDHFEINLRDLNGTDVVPSLQDCGSLPSLNFVFLPYDAQTQIVATTTMPTYRDASLVSAGNIVVTEYNSGNEAGHMYAEFAQSTGNLSFADINRGDHNISVNGRSAHFQDGIPFVTVSEDFRDNYFTDSGGQIGYGLATVYATSDGDADSTGWEIATHLADGEGGIEHNINYGVSFFPYEAGFAMRAAEPVSYLTGSDTLTVDNASVDTRTDGLLFVNSVGNESNYVTAAPTTAGSGWDVTVYDSAGIAKAGFAETYNYLYLPFGEDASKNVAMASVDAAGTVRQSQGGITVTQDTSTGLPGVYRVTIDGKTPEDGTLMLTATNGGSASGNAFVVYEAEKDTSGNLTGAFLVHGYQGVATGTGDPNPIDTGFNLAFVDFENAPALGAEAVNPFDTPTVAAASWQITAQNGDNTSPIITRKGTSDAAFDLTDQLVTSRGDLQVAWDNGPLYSARGLLFTQVCENQRDNSAIVTNTTTDPVTYSYDGHGMATPHAGGNGYWIATSVLNSKNGEYDVDVAAAFIPYGAGFQMGWQAIPAAKYQLRLEGTGDVRQTGVLITNATGNDDNFSTSWVNDDGTGWNVECHDNGSSFEGDDFAYVYLPYGTENLTAGMVHNDGGLYNATGDFLLERVYDVNGDGSSVAGVYRLTIKEESPETGVLLLTSGTLNYSNENTLTYGPELDAQGNPTGAFLIQGLDTGSGPATAANTDFSFAFLSYDNPIANPTQRELLDPSVCSAGNINAIQHTTGNANPDVTTFIPQDATTFQRQATDRFFNRSSNRGDYNVAIDGLDTNAQTGLLMATARSNGVDNGDGDGACVAIVGAAFNASTPQNTTWVSLGRMGGLGTASGISEMNSDVAVAYFDFDGNWAGAFVNGTDGQIVSSGLGDYTVTHNDIGSYTLTIDGVRAADKGLLFAIAGSNDDELISVASRGAGVWDLGILDGTTGDLDLGTGMTDAQFSFLYLPMGTFEGHAIDNLLGAQIDADGSVVMSKGDFTLLHEGAGTYRLSIDGVTPDDAMLLLTAAGDSLQDNVFSYEANGSDFLIKSNDLGSGTTGLLEDAGFNFALINFDNPMSVIEGTTPQLPGDANGDGRVDGSDVTILAGNWQTLSGASWAMGDFNGDGKVDGSDVTILAGNWQAGVNTSAASVPEPATITLLAILALCGLAACRKK